MNPVKHDVLVIGAGVIGLSCALELLKAGRGVRVIDAGRIGRGSSHGNCGTITPSHAVPLAAPGMISKALRWMLQPDAPLYIKPRWDPALWHWLWRFAARCNERDYLASARPKAAILNLSRQALEATIRGEELNCEFATEGELYVYRDSASLDAAVALVETLRPLGVRAELFGAARLNQEEPALRDGLAGAVHFPDDAALRPDRFVAELARRVRERGAHIIEECEATEFKYGPDGRIAGVGTTQGEIHPAEVVLACGAWSPRIGRELQWQLPIQPGKGYSITFSRPSQVPSRPLLLRERSVCVTTWGSGFRLGSTMEFSGYDTGLNRLRLEALRRGAAEYLREPEGAEVHEEWYGWRPMTWDDLPIIGRAAHTPNLMLATGHGMLGMSMASATARLVCDLMSGRAPPIDPLPYSPRRFAKR
jgi:D-amino-acid dehydrogenase